MNIIEKIKLDLGDNLNSDDEEILKQLIKNYYDIASNETNRDATDKLLDPYVYTAVKSAYIRRGKEGSSSNSEGGLTDSYVDIEEKLKKDVRSIRLLP